jgi:4-hydroxy-3-methylbut-2-enyl diphosphate reductase IspH
MDKLITAIKKQFGFCLGVGRIVDLCRVFIFRLR